jgi:hypothetical protein
MVSGQLLVAEDAATFQHFLLEPIGVDVAS